MQEHYNSIASLIFNIKNNYNSHTILHDLNTQNSLTGAELYKKVIFCAAGLNYLGVSSGSSVVIMANSSILWVIADAAIAMCGGVSIPIYTDISSENLDYEINDSNAEFAIVSSTHLAKTLSRNPNIKKIIVNEDVDNDPVLMFFDELIQLGETIVKKNPVIINEMIGKIDENDVYTIVYTSGSTAKPKGVELTHSNVLNQLYSIRKIYTLESDLDEALSFLPMAHIFERMVILFYLQSGIKINFVDDVTNVSKYLKEVNPTVMTVVPRVLEKIYAKIRSNANESYIAKRLIANNALNNAFEDDRFNIKTPKHRLYNLSVYSKVRAIFGKRLNYLIVGGAPLSLSLHRFFLNIGVPLYQGYGMTECSPVISVNTPKENRVGTCGKVLDGVEVRLEGDGEILVKSRSLMKGYHHLKEATNDVIDRDGWFHTGDLGSIDSDGFLSVHSRKNELLKTSTGEYVRAVYIEQQLSHHKDIDMVLIVADGKKFASALIFSSLNDNSKVINRFVRKLNLKLNNFEQIKKFTIINEIPTIAKGLLTPSQKLRREKVLKYFSDKIDSMYEDD